MTMWHDHHQHRHIHVHDWRYCDVCYVRYCRCGAEEQTLRPYYWHKTERWMLASHSHS